MIAKVGKTTSNIILDLQGLKDDIKPILEIKNAGSSFYVINGGDYYIFGADLIWYLQ